MTRKGPFCAQVTRKGIFTTKSKVVVQSTLLTPRPFQGRDVTGVGFGMPACVEPALAEKLKVTILASLRGLDPFDDCIWDF